MHVVATAGHVDHGKSTLVRALTGMEPDRWAEERRRGMTIDLGFAWTRLPGAGEVAFVDVPGHERFVPNMLAGVGPVPAVLFVVAADEGWARQSGEHLAALDALGVRHGLVAVTRSDLADPRPAVEQARGELARTTLGAVPAVAVSGTTGAGLDRLRAALADLVARLDPPDAAAPVRLWVDRSFTVRGAGTVVTGTLAAGRLGVGDELLLEPAGRRVRVRGLQALGEPRDPVEAVARVAVNLRGVDREDVGRGDALVTPGQWLRTELLDVRLRGLPAPEAAREQVLHVGAAQVAALVRPLGDDTARLRLATPLPLRIGDTALLRDPGARRVAGVTVLDVRPPGLRRRGSGARRAEELAALGDRPDGAGELRRRGVVRADELRAMGAAPPSGVEEVAGWLLDPDRRSELAARLMELVREHAAAAPLEAGLPVEAARARLGLPDARLVAALVGGAGPGGPGPGGAGVGSAGVGGAGTGVRDARLEVAGGRVRLAGASSALPPELERALAALDQELAAAPFVAPDAGRLTALGLGARQLAAAVRAGRLVAVAEGVVLLPGAPERAARALAALPQPFTLSEARQALGTTRRVAVPLLELLDRRRLTRRLPDDRRELLPPTAAG